MVLDRLLGGLDIEERRPRYWNEPRRKRLQFVKNTTHKPEDWRLVSSTNAAHHHRPTQQEVWDHHQLQAAGRFHHQERMREQDHLHHEHQLWLMRQPPQHPPPGYLEHEGHDPRIQPLPPPRHGDERSHRGGHPDDIVAVCSDDSSSDSDESSRHSVRYIEIKPTKLPKEYHHKRSKSKDNKKHKKPKKPSNPLFSDSSDSEDSFAEGFRQGVRANSRKPAGRGRSRSRSRHFYAMSDDSFEDLHPVRFRLNPKGRR